MGAGLFSKKNGGKNDQFLVSREEIKLDELITKFTFKHEKFISENSRKFQNWFYSKYFSLISFPKIRILYYLPSTPSADSGFLRWVVWVTWKCAKDHIRNSNQRGRNYIQKKQY